MTCIISLQGPMASGKTTLARRLEQRGFQIVYENPYEIVEKRKNKFGYLHKRGIYYKSKNVYWSKNKRNLECARVHCNI